MKERWRICGYEMSENKRGRVDLCICGDLGANPQHMDMERCSYYRIKKTIVITLCPADFNLALCATYVDGLYGDEHPNQHSGKKFRLRQLSTDFYFSIQ